jgi:transaldolase/glucose-6-phosphate isomerase
VPARRHGEPSIFEKAILDSTDSDEELEAPREQLDAKTIQERLALRDVQVAADVLVDLHRETNGRDGFVSLEVSPELAHHTTGTLAEYATSGGDSTGRT